MQSCGSCTKRTGLERGLGGEKVLCCVEQILMLYVPDLIEVQPSNKLLPDCCSRVWVGGIAANPTLLRYFDGLGLWLLMREELLPSLLEWQCYCRGERGTLWSGAWKEKVYYSLQLWSRDIFWKRMHRLWPTPFPRVWGQEVIQGW